MFNKFDVRWVEYVWNVAVSMSSCRSGWSWARCRAVCRPSTKDAGQSPCGSLISRISCWISSWKIRISIERVPPTKLEQRRLLSGNPDQSVSDHGPLNPQTSHCLPIFHPYSGVGSNLQVGGRNFFWCAPSLFSCAPSTWGGTSIVCYRLRDNWSGEVGRGAIKVMGPSTYSYTHTHRLTAFLYIVRPLQKGHGCITSKMIKYSYWTLNAELK